LLRLLALDFDGVISDSAPEAFAVALLTYTELFSDSKFCDRRGDLERDRLPSSGELTADPLYESFLELMPLGNRAEDYAVIFSALEAGKPIVDQAAYDSFRSEIDGPSLQKFHTRFYENRILLSNRDAAGWRRLMGPYPQLLPVLARRSADAVLAIATAKDRRSVQLLLRDYGIEDLFPEDRVLDKETGVHKDSHLRQLHRAFGVGYAEMMFIDDKVNHLETVAELGVRCALASWGYNGAREVERARERGYLICTLEGVESQLFGS
jgi:phosphoglycolate phosphatase-like HAD superfamily hydrolase